MLSSSPRTFSKALETFSGRKTIFNQPNQYLKFKESFQRLKLLAWGEPLFILRKCEYNSSVIISRFVILLRLSRCKNFSGPSRNRPLVSVRKDQKEVGNVTCVIVAVLSPVKNFIEFYQESTLLQAQNVYVDVLMPGDAILPLHRKIAWRATSCGRLITVSLHLKFITTVFSFAFATLKFSQGYHELYNAPPKGGFWCHIWLSELWSVAWKTVTLALMLNIFLPRKHSFQTFKRNPRLMTIKLYLTTAWSVRYSFVWINLTSDSGKQLLS